jgi:hypothetical protein
VKQGRDCESTYRTERSVRKYGFHIQGYEQMCTRMLRTGRIQDVMIGVLLARLGAPVCQSYCVETATSYACPTSTRLYKGRFDSVKMAGIKTRRIGVRP